MKQFVINTTGPEDGPQIWNFQGQQVELRFNSSPPRPPPVNHAAAKQPVALDRSTLTCRRRLFADEDQDPKVLQHEAINS